MKNYVFGYGSLINPESAAKTLNRILTPDEMKKVILTDYGRYWDLVDYVHFEDSSIVNAVFLDVQNSLGKKVNGIIIEVSEEDLKNLDKRERNYDRVDVTAKIIPTIDNCQIFTYVGKKEFLVTNFGNVCILSKYVDIVTKGLSFWDSTFSEMYYQTTIPHNLNMMSGSYTFVNKI